MDIGGFFSNWGNWSPDKARNDALNQGVNTFGARMLQGSGSGKNFSSILGGAIEAGQGQFNEQQQAELKRRMGESDIRYKDGLLKGQESEAEYRKAQIAKMLADQQVLLGRMQARSSVFGPQSATDAALGAQAQQGGAGPTVAAQGLAQQYAQQGVPQRMPTHADLTRLAGMGALEATDVSLVNELNNPKSYAPGSRVDDPRTRTSTVVPRLEQGQAQRPDGSVYTLPGFGESLSGIESNKAYGQQLGKSTVDLRMAPEIAGRTTAANEAAKAPYAPPIKVWNPVTQREENVDLPTWAASAGRGGGTTAAGPSLPQQRQNENIRLFNEKFQKETLPKVQEAAGGAREALANMQAVERLSIQTGWGTQTVASLGNVFTSLKVAPERWKNLTTQAQIFNSFLYDGVLLKQLAQAGPQTESDAARMQSTLPQLSNTPEANQLIIGYIKGAAEIKIAKDEFYSGMNATGASPAQIEQAWKAQKLSVWNMPSMQVWDSRFPPPPPKAQ